jgi:hypothetical protein
MLRFGTPQVRANGGEHAVAEHGLLFWSAADAKMNRQLPYTT